MRVFFRILLVLAAVAGINEPLRLSDIYAIDRII